MKDNDQVYGAVTRLLHWGMALALLWMFFTTSVRVVLEEGALYDLVWPTHRNVGALLFLLALLRVLWAWANRGERPPAVNALAPLGQRLLYALMVVIPSLGLLRQFGSGRAFEPFGIPLMPGFEGDSIDWMVSAGSLFHGFLGWTLATLILGHIAMALYHQFGRRPDVLWRITGRPRD